MRKLVAVLALSLVGLAVPAVAAAHPLGNFTTNRFSEVTLSGRAVYVHYVLDLAEIPTFQERDTVAALGRRTYGARLARDVGARLTLTVDGARVPLRQRARRLAFLAGVGGLKTTRLDVVFAGRVAGRGGHALSIDDRNYANRLGWREIVVRAERGARLRASSAPAESVSGQLRAYPKDLLRSPLRVSRATASFTPGAGTGSPPRLVGIDEGPVRVASASDTGFAALINKNDLSLGVILVSLLVALFWGAAHALTPGHGKAVVGAYLVGARGNARHAALLGLTVTVTHTIGVFALGLVTLALSEFVVPETLYPWLNLISALLVVAVGLAVLRHRIVAWFRGSSRGREAGGHHHHDHHAGHHHGHDHHHDDHHRHDSGRGHSHVPPEGSGLRGLIAVGVSGGLLPCPTALVVLLAAISLHRVAYGLLLIVAFSVGLAAVVTGIGLLAVTAKRTFGRLSFEGPLVRVLPAISALVIIGLGMAMTARSLPKVF